MSKKQQQAAEAEAWLIVAEEFRAGRTSKYLCHATNNSGVKQNRRVASIPSELQSKMKAFLDFLLDGNVFAYEISWGEGRDARLTALTLFAAMAKDGATNV